MQANSSAMPPCCHVFQRYLWIRKCKPRVLTTRNQNSSGDPKKVHPVVNSTLQVTCIQNTCRNATICIREDKNVRALSGSGFNGARIESRKSEFWTTSAGCPRRDDSPRRPQGARIHGIRLYFDLTMHSEECIDRNCNLARWSSTRR